MTTFQQKKKLLQGLLTGEVAHTGPFYATVDITRRCNSQCIGCRYHSPTVNMPSPGDQDILDVSLDLFKKMCNEIKAMGTKTLILMGEGEPFLHPLLCDFVSLAKKLGFHITLLTNGTLLNKENILSLIDSRLDVLKISLWASSSEEYERNTHAHNASQFGNIIDGLKLLTYLKTGKKSHLPSVELFHPINRYNFQSIDAMVDVACTVGCDTLSFSPFRTRRRELVSLALSPDEEISVRLSLFRIKKRLNSLSIGHNIKTTLLRYKISESVWKKLPCYIGWFHVRLKVDGTILLCDSCDLIMGNLKEDTLSEIWNNPAIRTFRRQTFTCKGLEAMSEHCDCGFCCYIGDNTRIHRLIKWFLPFAPQHRING